MDGVECYLTKLLQSGAYHVATRNAGSFHFPANYRFEWHVHDEIEINYVVGGQCIMGIGTEYVSLRQGDCIVIYPGVSHCFIVNLKQTCRLSQLEFALSLPSETSPIAFIEEARTSQQIYVKLDNCQEIAQILGSIAAQKRSEKTDELSRVALRIDFLRLYMMLSEHIQYVRVQEKKAQKDCMTHVLEYITHHFTDEINMIDLCSLIGVSDRYVRKRFWAQVGMTSNQYITALRVSKAKELLCDLSRSVTDVALQTGFASSQYFSRVFRGETGVSPQEYRKSLRQFASKP